MQKIGLVAAFVLAVVASAWATEVSEDITLTEDTTYSGLTGTGTITGAAGDVPIVLTIATDEDCTFDGSLVGNLKVVKTGSGLQTFTKANSFTGGLRIEGGYVSVSAANQLGSGGFVLAGGGLEATDTFSVAKDLPKSVVGSGSLRVSENKILTLSGQLVITDAALTIRGAGKVVYNQTFDGCAEGATIEVKDTAKFRGAWGSSLGGVVSDWGIRSVIVREGATIELIEGCTLHGELVLEGGTVLGIVTQQNLDKATGRLEEYVRVAGLGLDCTVKVLPCKTPAKIVANFIALTSDPSARNVFDVADGATLLVDGTMVSGRALTDSGASAIDYQHRVGEGFDKTGAGTLAFVKPVGLDGIIEAKGGSIEFGRDAYLSKNAMVLTSNGGKVVLRDGSVFESGLGGLNGFLAQADVWLDAAPLASHAADGDRIAAVPNRGTAGGTFLPGTSGTATKSPYLLADGIGGRSVLRFNGSESLILTNFVNSTTYDYTLYCVHAKAQGWNTSIVLETGPSTWTMPEGVEYGERLKPESHELYYSGVRQLRQCFNYAKWNGTSNPYRSWDAKGYPSGVADAFAPVLTFGSCFRQANGKGSAKAWERFGDDDETEYVSLGVGTVMEASKIAPRRIDTVNLGCRTLLNRETTSGGHVNIGELLIFARTLTDAEQLTVESYLRRKWFASSVAAPEWSAADRPVAAVEVAAGEKAVFKGSITPLGGEGFAKAGKIVKTGDGELTFGSDASAAAVESSGGLRLAPACVSRASVWVDATDSTAATVVDGRIHEFVNKGRAGGSFRRGHVGNFEDTDPKDKYWVKGPVFNASGINGQQTISFDGESGLMLDSYTNYNDAAANDLHVYAVLKRNSFEWQDNGDGTRSPKSGKGNLACPYALGMGAVGGTETVSDIDQDGAFVPLENGRWVNNGTTNVVIFYMGKTSYSAPGNVPLSNNYVLPMRSCPNAESAESAYLFAGHCNRYGITLGTELPTDDPEKFNLSTRDNGGVSIDGLATYIHAKQIDTVSLGGRFWSRKGTHPTFRYWKTDDGANYMWNGEMGEFIVFDQGLTLEDEKELLAYLRKKWFDKGEGSATPPACLTGTVAVPTTDAATTLELKSGSSVVKSVGTLELESLTVGEDVEIVQRGLTSDKASAKVFAVDGEVSLAGPVTLDLGLTRELRKGWGYGPVPLLTFGSWSADEGDEFLPVNPDISPRHAYERGDDSVDLVFESASLILIR